MTLMYSGQSTCMVVPGQAGRHPWCIDYMEEIDQFGLILFKPGQTPHFIEVHQSLDPAELRWFARLL